jgi:hypothetical protein
MVTFAVCAFELIILFKQSKHFLLVGIFIILWIVVTVFSMVSTVAGQYNAKINLLTDRYKEEVIQRDQDNSRSEFLEQKKEYQDTLQILRKDISYYGSLLSEFNTREAIAKDQIRYNSISWNYRKIKNEIEILSKKLSTLRQSKVKHSIKKSAPDFYMWVSNLWGWDPEMIQFWMSIFPALFIDLIAPISVAVFMFVKKG